MPPRRKAGSAADSAKASKKRATNPPEPQPEVSLSQQVEDLYHQCVSDGPENQRMDKIKEWGDKGAVLDVVWPFLSTHLDSKLYFHGCYLFVAMVSMHYMEGSFGDDNSILVSVQGEKAIDKLLQTLLYKTERKDIGLQSQIVHFLSIAMASNNKELQDAILVHTSGDMLLHWLPSRRMDFELKKSAGLRRKFSQLKKQPVWSVNNIDHVLQILEGHSDYGPLVKVTENHTSDSDDMTQDIPISVWNFLFRSLELLLDLLSISTSRFYLLTYLESVHFSVRSRLAVGNWFAVPEKLRLVQVLLGRINGLLAFPIDGVTQVHLSKVDVVAKHHNRASLLQKMAHRHFPEELQQVVFAGVGLLCGKQDYLERSLVGFSDKQLNNLLYKLRLVSDEDPEATRKFLLAVLGSFLSIPPYPMDQLRSYPLYPTESVLWDHTVIPPSNVQLRSTEVLALPKLNSRFLSFQDYLLRNYELVRLESAYEIRADLVNVIRRVKPVIHETISEETQDVKVATQFNGWSRMALELAQPFRLVEVSQPKLGDTIPSRVLGEVVVDLEPCGESIRREWDEIGEYDNLFLITIDASQMKGGDAPLLRDYHLNHGSHRVWDTDSERRVPEEEDSSFPKRFGIVAVRGCMVLQVRNEHDTIMSEPGVRLPEKERGSTKRILKVQLDPAQYSHDSRKPNGTDIYKGFNLLVRRHGRENNFKAVLETIRGLLEGAGSIDRVIPPWLQSLVLGNGDPSSAWYKSAPMKQYAIKTVGVNKPTDFLDFGDTFLDEAHLRASFDADVVLKESGSHQAEDDNACNFKLRFPETSASADGSNQPIEAIRCKRASNVTGNPIRFTPVQVEAIRSGLSPGLTLVVGPPGTGKTDVAVQIIASLFHSFPTQRTVIITHSNAALNDIFSKVMARGDTDERYFVRLGAGERDLQTESTHDFTKLGRVAFSLQQRDALLERVQQLSESLGISGKAQRGADGAPSYTCETADYFQKHEIFRRRSAFLKAVADQNLESDTDVGAMFPFAKYFGREQLSLQEAQVLLEEINALFTELQEYRPYELLRTQRQRSDYLISKQARIVAMTCTHAAIARSNLLELGFEYDNVVMEESAQMLEIESFIPLLLQRGKSDKSVSGLSRLKRVCMLGDHNQLPPVVKNAAFSKYSNFDQSLFSRLIKLGVPYVQLDKQGRARPELMELYGWRYKELGNLSHVSEGEKFQLANPGFVHTRQMVDVGDFDGKGESCPTPYYYQNLGEAEYAVALFQYMVLIGYSPKSIAILTTYNGQKELITDILRQRCGAGTPLDGVWPSAVSTVDQFQGQQADYILLSLVRTKAVGHIRDVRRLVVAVSRARLGLYVLGRRGLFCQAHELRRTMSQLEALPGKLQLVAGETTESERKQSDAVDQDKIFEVTDLAQLGSIVHSMQESMLKE
eukprot:Nitzschia sp. Nitz4//scaffold3_size479765//306225//310635//NITZ4_000127-RA/size479765-augustus-gene-1.609-mRNA-1//-1//CDS//3329550839//8519//frame0